MQIHKNHFLQYCLNSAATLGLPLSVLGKLEQALTIDWFEIPKVIWFNGTNCTGCTIYWGQLFNERGSFFSSDHLLKTIDLNFHSDLMTAFRGFTANRFTDIPQGSYIIAVDGDIPTAFHGHTCMLSTNEGEEMTAMEALQMLAPNAVAVLAIGTCASFGETLSSNPNSKGIVSVSELTGVPTLNIPGCPIHPDWVVWTIAHLLSGEAIQLDEHNRPIELYGSTVQKHCPHKEFADFHVDTTPGQSSGCLQFTKVIWDPQTCRLNVAGEGTTDQVVSIYNADSGTLLGAVPVNELGKWRLHYNKPFPIPLRLLAKSDNETVFGEVGILPNVSH